MTKPGYRCVALIADSHFHPPDEDRQSAYASDQEHNQRSREVVRWINESPAELVFHLGDVPHPVPGLDSHRVALDEARACYDGLRAPLHVTPGNHDVGDKPDGWASAPAADADKHAVFSSYWGADSRALDWGGHRFIMLNSPILNSGSPAESRQRSWLEEELQKAREAAQRVFLFTHYPPYLMSPDEPEHYDNLAEPARSWLLDLLQRFEVEALFCGHVHHFFWDRVGSTDIYLLPSTSFIRPEYSELQPLAPGDEYGRNEVEKLGFALLHIGPSDHRLELIRTHRRVERAGPEQQLTSPGSAPGWSCPLGASLRGDLAHPHAIPLGNLDEFRRKSARNDLPIQGLWELGMPWIRIPASDLRSPQRRARLRALAARGLRLLPFSTESSWRQEWPSILAAQSELIGWELITRSGRWPEGLPHDLPAGLTSYLSALGRRGGQDEAQDRRYFSHFPPHGFALEELPELDGEGPGGLVLRMELGAEEGPRSAWKRLAASALESPLLIQLVMRRGEEGSPYTDDAQQVPFLVEAFMQAARRPDWLVYLDTFIDHDRGYYPRHGLLDRRSHPRAGFRALSQLARLAEGASGQEQPWGWSLPAGQLWLSSLGCPPDAAQRSWRCLITGDSAEPGDAGVLWASA